MTMRTCSLPKCEDPHHSRGYCSTHYYRWRRHGDPLTVQVIRGDPVARFHASYTVDPETGCRVWHKTISEDGYAQFWDGERYVGGHIWAWTQEHGPVPEGKQLDHFVCDRSVCVHEGHVRPVTHRENTLRSNSIAAQNRAKTHCKWDHEFTPENTYDTGDGGRGCKKCKNRRNKAWREKQNAQAHPDLLPG